MQRNKNRRSTLCIIESLENRELLAADFAVQFGQPQEASVFDWEEQNIYWGGSRLLEGRIGGAATPPSVAHWEGGVIYHGTESNGQHFGSHQVDAFFASNGDQTSIVDWEENTF